MVTPLLVRGLLYCTQMGRWNAGVPVCLGGKCLLICLYNVVCKGKKEKHALELSYTLSLNLSRFLKNEATRNIATLILEGLSFLEGFPVPIFISGWERHYNESKVYRLKGYGSMARPHLEPRPLDPDSSAPNVRAPDLSKFFDFLIWIIYVI